MRPYKAFASLAALSTVVGSGPIVVGRAASSDKGQLYQLLSGAGNAYAELRNAEDNGEQLTGIYHHPNQYRDKYNTEGDMATDADFLFIADDRSFNRVGISFIPNLDITDDKGGTHSDFPKLADPEFLKKCKRESFSGTATFSTEEQCPDSLDPGSLCMRVVTAPVTVTGDMRVGQTRSVHGMDMDPQYYVTLDSEALGGSHEVLAIRRMSAGYRWSDAAFDAKLDKNGNLSLSNKRAMMTKTGPPRSLIPCTGLSPVSGRFWPLLPLSD
ncbi:hypothetical protein BD324DRAFT_680787 [Kockovaella imperatae]|uniref:Uncharacterized protein n=1 Tax=Kockovaella imperatae TaxID=4999 RepID=A0A1Y1UKC1_9TREE|nr:hypothetical protein BD324DRAFT_680787 [Kockovaella imperatae]ORX37916.1 hypothetical protein BD324DRAFT_680787 [Kockovaella imperatae]